MRRFVEGLRKTTERLAGSLQGILAGGAVDESTLEDLEGLLLGADLGPDAAERIIAHVRSAAGEGDAARCRAAIAEELLAIMDEVPLPEPPAGRPRVIIVAGVNGVGKTSTIGKLAHRFTAEGKTVLLAACDTFRAAAIEQLEAWAERVGVPLVRQQMGADPAAVAFDAVQSAVARGVDIVIVDTAGRLHTKVNLMDELRKIATVLRGRIPGIGIEAWLVLDANTGQNSLRQARAFTAALPVTGLILTKLDSTARGGAVVAIQQELRVPVLFVGVGEKASDLEPFDRRLFVDALLGGQPS